MTFGRTTPASLISQNWKVISDGPLAGDVNMQRDEAALNAMNRGETETPVARFFQWKEPTISYGHLLDEERVRAWAGKNGNAPVIRRPTGGGAVLHQLSDLSLSLLWPRAKNILPDHPRACYQTLHTMIIDQLSSCLPLDDKSRLFLRPSQTCEQPEGQPGGQRFSLCFADPVCNDVMWGEKKILGGALRVMRKAILYQGTLQGIEQIDRGRMSAVISEGLCRLSG